MKRTLPFVSLVWLTYSCGEPAPAFQETAAIAAEANIEVAPEAGSVPSTITTGAFNNPEALDPDIKAEIFPDGEGPNSSITTGSEPGLDISSSSSDPNSGTSAPDTNTSNPGLEGLANFELYSQDSIQKGNGKVDILWVIDNSGSMKEEQDYLGANFVSFINGLSLTGIDFQTAITNTDVCDDSLPAELIDRSCPFYYGGDSTTHLRGDFVGPVLKSGSANLSIDFKSQTAIGTNGSSFEHGLKATELAIQKALTGQSEALVRDGSFLSVIVVSDEEDDGIGLGKVDAYNLHNFIEDGLTQFSYTPDHLLNYLNTAKGAGQFSVSAITGTRLANGSMCSAAHSQPLEEGTAYIDIANKTGGSLQSICDTDWGNSLYQLGQDLTAQATQILLDRQPLASSIQVTVDGDSNTAWTYFPAINTIKFDASALPSVGAAIHVEYMAAKSVD